MLVMKIEEIQDVLAEFENRIRYLEMSAPYKREEEPTEVVHRHINYHSNISKKQWDRIEQAIRKASWLEKGLIEKETKKKSKWD